jgi:hypothetical protein
MANDDRAQLTVTLPNDLSISLIRIAGRLRLTPSQIVKCACRDLLGLLDLLTRQPRASNEPSAPEKGRASSYIEMTAREEAHDVPAPPSRLPTPAIAFRPLGSGNRAAQKSEADLQRGFRRIAHAATAFAEEQARRGSWLCEPADPVRDETASQIETD